MLNLAILMEQLTRKETECVTALPLATMVQIVKGTRRRPEGVLYLLKKGVKD